MPKKESKTLHKRAKLNPDQLDRVQKQYGEGEQSKYTNDGVQNLALTRALHKAKSKVPRYVLFSDRLGRRAYVAKSEYESRITFELSEALEFIEGFDNPELKKRHYNEFFANRLKIDFDWLTKRI
jgi:hypothetical protein